MGKPSGSWVRSLRMGSVVASVVTLVAVVAAALMVVYVPIRLFELSGTGGLNVIAAGVFSAISMIAGAVVAFFAVVIGVPLLTGVTRSPEEKAELSLKRKELEEKLTMYRARQRAMLEELDEIRRVLEEIRDILKEGVEG